MTYGIFHLAASPVKENDQYENEYPSKPYS
jgi:hypothetical protein